MDLERLDFFETLDRAPQDDQDDDDDEEEDEDEDEDEEEDGALEEEDESSGCLCKGIEYDDEVEYYNIEDLGDDDGYY